MNGPRRPGLTSGLLVRHGVDEARVALLELLHGALVPQLVNGPVVDLAEVPDTSNTIGFGEAMALKTSVRRGGSTASLPGF